MDVRITPSPLRGQVAAIPSKSETHRLLICAALADRETVVPLASSSRDVEATIGCLRALGAEIGRGDGAVVVRPVGRPADAPVLACGESGSTLRFLLPVAAALGAEARFTGAGRLPARPIAELTAALTEHGVAFDAPGLPFRIAGRLRGGEFRIRGDVSSQYLSGLLLALPLTGEESVIRLTTELESASYAALTQRALERFGVRVRAADGTYVVAPQRFVSPGRAAPGGDWSNAAAFLAAAASGAGEITVVGLDGASAQGDRAACTLLRSLGARVTLGGGAVSVSGGALRGGELDMADTPDLLPVLAAAAATAEGETRFVRAGRLRWKESDRLAATAALLNALGGRAEITADGLLVRGGALRGGDVDSFGDHRLVMAAAVAAARAEGSVVIRGADAVEKSYPTFFEDYKKLGGKVDVI